MVSVGVHERRALVITSLPYTTRVYINNQVLIPASLVKALGLERAWYARVVLVHDDREIVLDRVRLLRTRHTASRQFTIPREIRERFGIGPLDVVTIVRIVPLK